MTTDGLEWVDKRSHGRTAESNAGHPDGEPLVVDGLIRADRPLYNFLTVAATLARPVRSTQPFSITLPNDMADAVRAKVASGEYATESEVIRDGLRALLARDQAIEQWLRDEIAAAYDALKAAPGRTGPRRVRCPGSSSAGDRAQAGHQEVVTACTVVFAPGAEDSLVELYEHIAEHSPPALAQRYTAAIVTCRESLATLPLRGTPRDDVRPNLRITNYRRRTVIAFEVDEAGRRVASLGVFYGGRDYESALGAAIDWQSSPDHR